VGDGRNDDTDRLYVASAECIYEYTWNGADWDTQYVGTAHMVYTNWIYDLAIGRGRDDDTIRIYASGQNIPGEYGAYEFTWNGTAWIREPITFLAAHWQNYAIEVGDGRNDGVQRVYIGGNNGILFEFTWNGTGWDSIAVHDDGGTKWTIIIGNGRSDDPPHNRVYEACHDGHVYESTWNDSTATWNNVDVGIGIGLGIDNNMWGIGIGKGRNDGIERVFAGNYDHRVYEFSYPGVGVAEIVYRHPQMSILAYPNPFNSVCFIEIPANTKIKIVDITGRCIKTIANPSNSNMAFHWHPDKSLVSGIFLVYIENEGETIARQVFYIK